MSTLPTIPLSPFGVVVTAPTAGADLRSLPVEDIKQWIATHRIVCLRGFAPPMGDDLPEYCKVLGEILEWDFGAVNNLVVKADAKNYIFTNRAVPFHWDGAFVGRVPHYIFFVCDIAPPIGSGGETLFTDAIEMVRRGTPEQYSRWKATCITYSTDKVVHYGGSFTSPLIAPHPISGTDVIRYAEPVADLNPVRLEVAGATDAEQAALVEEMHDLLYDPTLSYAHEWRDGDILIADNHATLHGRHAFDQPERRQIRRVNIL